MGQDREEVERDALAAARAIVDNQGRGQALVAVARHLEGPVQDEVLSEAVVAANAIDDSAGRSSALAAVAICLAAAGAVDRARELARSIEEGTAEALVSVAEYAHELCGRRSYLTQLRSPRR